MSTFYNLLKWLGFLPLSTCLIPFDVNPSNLRECNKYIRKLLPISKQFAALRMYCKKYYGHIPEEIFIEIELMIGEMNEDQETLFLNNYYDEFIRFELKRIYWLPYCLGWIQMFIIVSYCIFFLFFLSAFHIIYPLQKLFMTIYFLSWILFIVVTIQIIGIGMQICLLNKTNIFAIKYAFKLSIIDHNNLYIPLMKWCNALRCDNCSNLNCIYLIIEKYGLLYCISILLILSNNYHWKINYWFIKMLSYLYMESLYYRMYAESNAQDDGYFFMYIMFWIFHLGLLPMFSLINAFPKRKMLSLSFRYVLMMIFFLLVFLFICYLWYFQFLITLIYTNIVWLFCMGIVSLCCAAKCIRKYVYYGYYSKYDGDGKEYLKLALQHFGCVFLIDALFLSIAGLKNHKFIYILVHILSIVSSYLYYLQIQIRLQYKQCGHCENVNLNTYCCAWLLTYHHNFDCFSEESYTDSSVSRHISLQQFDE